MEDGDPVGEALLDHLRQLEGQRDLRHQVDDLPALGDDMLGTAQEDLALAASRHAVQVIHGIFRLADCLDGRGLFRGELPHDPHLVISLHAHGRDDALTLAARNHQGKRLSLAAEIEAAHPLGESDLSRTEDRLLVDDALEGKHLEAGGIEGGLQPDHIAGQLLPSKWDDDPLPDSDNHAVRNLVGETLLQRAVDQDGGEHHRPRRIGRRRMPAIRLMSFQSSLFNVGLRSTPAGW